MNKRPNFGLAATTSLVNMPNNDTMKFAVKPFDGFKTGQNSNNKPFDLRAAKGGSNTEHGTGSLMSVAALEKNLTDDINQLDWELAAQPKYAQSNTKLKPKLFQKKSDFNNTGETKATDGDWNIVGSSKKPTQALFVPKSKVVVKETSDWDLSGDHHSKPMVNVTNKPILGKKYSIITLEITK